MSCPICLNVINLEDIYHNSEKCANCLSIFHSNCTIRLAKDVNNRTKCPCCRTEYKSLKLSKLERLNLKSEMKLFKCCICGHIREKDHLYWCFTDQTLKERERVSKEEV